MRVVSRSPFIVMEGASESGSHVLGSDEAESCSAQVSNAEATARRSEREAISGLRDYHLTGIDSSNSFSGQLTSKARIIARPTRSREMTDQAGVRNDAWTRTLQVTELPFERRGDQGREANL